MGSGFQSFGAKLAGPHIQVRLRSPFRPNLFARLGVPAQLASRALRGGPWCSWAKVDSPKPQNPQVEALHQKQGYPPADPSTSPYMIPSFGGDRNSFGAGEGSCFASTSFGYDLHISHARLLCGSVCWG